MEIVSQNATSLAWIGDAYMSLRVRLYLVEKGIQNAHKLQEKSAKLCSAKGQSKILNVLKEEDYFNEDELEILRRGRNATIHSKAKNATGKEYLEATAIEACLGYLYLYGHQTRLDTLLDHMIEIGEKL